MRVAVTVTSPSDGRASSARCTASPVASAAMGAVVQGSPFSSVPKLSVNVPQTGCTPSTWPLASPAELAIVGGFDADTSNVSCSRLPCSAVNST